MAVTFSFETLSIFHDSIERKREILVAPDVSTMSPGRILALFRPPRELRFACDAPAIISVSGVQASQPVHGRMVDISQSRFRVYCFQSISRGTQVRVRVARALVFGKVRNCRPLDPSGFEIEIKTHRVVMHPHKATSRLTSVRPIRFAPMETSSPGKSLDVLLVEDNPGDVTLTRLVLDATGVAYRLEVARDGAEALYRLCGPGRPMPALMLLDLHLPEMNGIEVLERIRSAQVCPTMAVAFLSTSMADSDLRRVGQLGVRAYFEKPRNFREYEQLSRQVFAFLSELSY